MQSVDTNKVSSQAPGVTKRCNSSPWQLVLTFERISIHGGSRKISWSTPNLDLAIEREAVRRVYTSAQTWVNWIAKEGIAASTRRKDDTKVSLIGV